MRTLAGVFVPLALFAAPPATAEEWNRFRGPNGSGIAAGAGYPVDFGGKANALWRTPARPGKSSPVLTRRHVFLTAADADKLYTQCFDRATGRMLWERTESRVRQEIAHSLNHAASSTPVTGGEDVYVFFRDYGLVSYDPGGNVRWRAPLGPFTNSMGISASPILSGDSIIVLADQEEGAYLAAFDRRNGELQWKSPRARSVGWATPILHTAAPGGAQIVTSTAYELNAHAAGTGKPAWSHSGLSPAQVASPILQGDILYAFGYGYETPVPFTDTLAKYDRDKDGKLSPGEYGADAWLIKVGREFGTPAREVTAAAWDAAIRSISKPSALVAVKMEAGNTTRELWRYQRSFIGVIPSPILAGGLLYVLKNGGILTAFDAATGAVVKAGRVEQAADPYSASPVSAEGRLYLASEPGRITVLRTGRDWTVLAVNDLGEEIFATPALSGGRIFVRTAEALYCFGARPQSALSE